MNFFAPLPPVLGEKIELTPSPREAGEGVAVARDERRRGEGNDTRD